MTAAAGANGQKARRAPPIGSMRAKHAATSKITKLTP